jgi:peptidoglycan/xylan/chitin deacetylase (PgdA/CDA1 family)
MRPGSPIFGLVSIVRNLLKKIVYSIAFILVCAESFFKKPFCKKKLSVLYYHRVTDLCRDGMTIDQLEFEKHILYVKKHYQVISASQLLQWLDSPHSWSPDKHACLITFDDGYEDNFINALPVLKKYDCPAIFFVTTGMIGNHVQFPHDAILHPNLVFRKMSWEHLKIAAWEGIELGVHSQTHADLGKIPFEDAIREIEAAVHDFTTHLGYKPRMMSYPFGGRENITPEVKAYIRNHPDLLVLFSAYDEANEGTIERYEIKRINIGSEDRGIVFRYKVAKGHLVSVRQNSQDRKSDCACNDSKENKNILKTWR